MVALACVPGKVLAHAVILHLTEPTVMRSGILLGCASDFELAEFARITWNSKKKQIIFTRGTIRVVMTTGSRTAYVNGTRTQAPAAAEILSGKVLVPVRFVLQSIGLPEVEIASNRAESKAEQERGRIEGRVIYAGKPLAKVMLRLVRASDFSFVDRFRSVSEKDGRYRFSSVPDGSYRVYAYIGDNRNYFNRASPTVDIKSSSVKVSDIHMGRILDTQDPPRGAILSPEVDLVFTWTECPQADVYHVSVLDPLTREEVFSVDTHKPYTSVPISRLTPGHIYHWSVIANDSEGAFLGGTPGSGSEPLTFSLAVNH